MIDLISISFGVIACAALYFVLRRRVYIHITYSGAKRPPRSRTRAGSIAQNRRGEWSPAANQSDHEDAAGIPGVGCESGSHSPRVTPSNSLRGAVPPSVAPDRPYPPPSDDSYSDTADIFSALTNLRVKPKQAGAIAAGVVAELPEASFDDRLRAAIQRARECAA